MKKLQQCCVGCGMGHCRCHSAVADATCAQAGADATSRWWLHQRRRDVARGYCVATRGVLPGEIPCYTVEGWSTSRLRRPADYR